MTAWLAIIISLCMTFALLGAAIVARALMSMWVRTGVTRHLDMQLGRHGWYERNRVTIFESALHALAQASPFVSGVAEANGRLVRAAGLFAHGTVYRFIVLRILVTGGALVTSTSATALSGAPLHTAVLLPLLVTSVAHLCPSLLLRLRARRRSEKVGREMPVFLDTIKLLLQSGASVELSLRQIERIETVAIPEIQATLPYLLEDLDQGKSYGVAFSRWAEKLAIPEADDLSGMMLQSMTHGTELSPILGQFIHDLIERRLNTAREQAGKRSVWMTVVMIAFFLPPLMCVIAAPAATDIVRNFMNLAR